MRLYPILVMGTYDADEGTAEIADVQPAPNLRNPEADDSSSAGHRLQLVFLDAQGEVHGDAWIALDFGSCDESPIGGTFQRYVEVPENTDALSLQKDGLELARFVRQALDESTSDEGLGFGLQSAHTIPVRRSAASKESDVATYTLQAREGGTSIWQTLDVGMDRPDLTDLDLNQFPMARSLEVRVLKSVGFDAVEIYRDSIEFKA